jgi:enamine deaminase RidA (YjgF/YER057c/UK114 family)
MPRDAVVPSDWSDFYAASHIPAAVRIGDMVRLTGHTGTLADGSFPASVDGQVRQTFNNIGSTLAEAGGSWDDVVELTSYHIGLRAQSGMILDIAGEFLTDPYPAWTSVGVTELYEPDAVIEISCIAMISGRH